jgi:protein-S-isoprenylcysteine O-methyltransferase Ste14
LTERSRALRRLRVPLGFLVGILYFWFAPRLGGMTPVTLAVGGVIALVGVLFRAWAAGHIVKNDRLATTGPYAHTRNPLYFGSFLIGCGFAVAAHWLLLVAVALFFYAVYKPVIASEQDYISHRYPGEYAEWARHVPVFFPRLTPWRGGTASPGEGEPCSFPLYLRHREWQAGLVYLVAIAWLTFRLQRHF